MAGIDHGIGRQSSQILQALVHHFQCALKHPPAAEGKQAIPRKYRAWKGEGDMIERVA